MLLRRITRCAVGVLPVASACQALTTSSRMHLSSVPPTTTPTTKPARMLAIEINKLKAEYRMNPSPELQQTSLAALTEVPLRNVLNLDAKTVAHLLGALQELRAPSDHPTIREAGSWVQDNAAAITSTPLLAQALFSIANLNKEIGLDLIAALQDRINTSVADIDPSSASKLLAAARMVGLAHNVTQRVAPTKHRLTLHAPARSEYVERNNREYQSIEALGDVTRLTWQERCIDVLKHNIPSASHADLLNMAVALQHSPNEIMLLTDIIALSAQKVQMMDAQQLVTFIPVLATSFIPRTAREEYMAATLDALEAVVDTLGPADAAALYDALRGFPSTADPLAARLLVIGSRIPLLSATIGELLVIAGRLGRHAPPHITDILVTSIPRHYDAIATHPVSELKALFVALAVCPTLQQQGLHMKLGDQMVAALKAIHAQAKAAPPTPAGGTAKPEPHISAALMSAVMTTPMVRMYGQDLHAIALGAFEKWAYADTVQFLRACSFVNDHEARRIMRDMAQKVAQSVHTSSPDQLSMLSCAYGRAGVRNDILCNAVSEKCVADRKIVGPHGLASCLAFLAAVDYRNNKCFIEVQIEVRSWANSAGPTQVINLIASYAKMLLWNLKLFFPLIARAADLTEFFNVKQIIGLLVSVERVDVRHPGLQDSIVQRLHVLAPTVDAHSAVKVLSALSRFGIVDTVLFDKMWDAVKHKTDTLSVNELGEALMAFARSGLTEHPMYHDLIMPVLAAAPTATPVALSNIATAYGTIGLRHEELFEILADRMLVLKEECPAVTIAAALAAFARVGIRNDKLFIEMITRVRNVPSFGSPEDIVNVVSAYSMGGVWHLRLFTKLADRAIQLRGDFKGKHIAELLAAYARVEMKYEKLFVEFSPRIQACAPTLTPSELVSIANSFATALIADAAVFDVIGDRLTLMVSALAEEEKRALMNAYSKVGLSHNKLASALSGLPIPE